MADETNEELTAEEMKQLQHLVGTATTAEEKSNIHKFLIEVVKKADTSKVAYLEKDELGTPKFPVRTLQELALFCEDIAGMPEFAKFFRAEAEITLSTSLSRDAKLLELAVTSTRQIGEVGTKKKPTKENKGWFRKKNV